MSRKSEPPRPPELLMDFIARHSNLLPERLVLRDYAQATMKAASYHQEALGVAKEREVKKLLRRTPWQLFLAQRPLERAGIAGALVIASALTFGIPLLLTGLVQLAVWNTKRKARREIAGLDKRLKESAEYGGRLLLLNELPTMDEVRESERTSPTPIDPRAVYIVRAHWQEQGFMPARAS